MSGSGPATRKGLVELKRRARGSRPPAFITEVLDLYQAVAADSPPELNTFKFYQMEVLLAPVARPGEL